MTATVRLKKFLGSETFLQLTNMGLRLGSLGAKLLLSLYIARYLSLDDMGTYGLVAACIAIAIPLMGQRIDYVICREIVGVSPLETAHKMRDEAVFYGLNYVALLIGVLIMLCAFPHSTSTNIIWLTTALAILESFSTVTSTNFIYLKRPVFSTVLFFLRAAAWTIPVILIGFFFPSWRSIEMVFGFWIAGIAISLMVTFYALRYLPWADAVKTPVDWVGLRQKVIKCLPIWAGAVGIIAANNVDRFVVEYNLTRDLVGVISFYGSFVGAIVALVSNGVSVFKQAHLIDAHKLSELQLFNKISREMNIQAIALATFLTCAVGIVVPFLGYLLKKPLITDHAYVLWLMLFGVWLKMASEGMAAVIYARHQDASIWKGNIWLLAVSLGASALLVPIIGFNGVGYSAVLSGAFLVTWRYYSVKAWLPPQG